MKIAELSITNFLSIGSASIKLADRGLLLVQGVNEDDTSADSNGAGKSSMVDALCWCLYGTTARGEEGDKVVNRTAGKGCAVEALIEDGADTYRIARHRKHKTGKNGLTVSKDGGLTDLTKGTDKLTQAVVEGIVGASYEVFRASIYAGQESFPDLPAMTDKQLKVLVEEAAGTTVLETAYEDARARLAEVKGRAEKVETGRLRAAQRVVDIEVAVEAAKARKDDFDKARKDDADRVMAEAVAAAAEAKRLSADLGAHDEAGERAALKACDDAIASVSSEVAEERRLTAEAFDAAAKESMLRSRFEHLATTLRKQIGEVQAVNEQIGCPCNECARPLTAAELAPAKEARTARAVATRADVAKVKAETEGAIAAHKASADALSAFRGAMTDVSAKASQRASHAAEIAIIERLQAGVQAYVEKAKRLGDDRKAILARPNPHEAEILRLDGERAAAEKVATELREQLDELSKELRVAELGVEVFSPAGVRAQVLDTVTPFLNVQTARYLSTLSDDNLEATWSTLTRTAKGELRERFAIEVASKTGGERFGSVSGGEKRKVRIAAALALQDLVASRASKPIELWVGDEVDAALDNAGLERLMTVLEEKARERGTVVIISHQALRDWVPQVITVTKKDGFSTVVEEIA